jgi:hypothetical protein
VTVRRASALRPPRKPAKAVRARVARSANTRRARLAWPVRAPSQTAFNARPARNARRVRSASFWTPAVCVRRVQSAVCTVRVRPCAWRVTWPITSFCRDRRVRVSLATSSMLRGRRALPVRALSMAAPCVTTR